jgi:hypothetical protein
VEATDNCTVVLRYCPEVPIAVVSGEDRNMTVTEPVDVVLADRLFQLESQQPPPACSEADQRAALQGRRWSSAEPAVSDTRSSNWPAADVGTSSRSAGRRPGRATGRVGHVVNSARRAPAGGSRRGERGASSCPWTNYPAPPSHRAGLFTSSAHDPRIRAPLHVKCVNARPSRLQPLLLGKGRSGEPHAGARGLPEGCFPQRLARLEFDGNWSDLDPCSLISVWIPDEGRS